MYSASGVVPRSDEIINVPEIQALMNDFFELTGLPIGIIDMEGTVLVGTGWQDACTMYHRVHPDTLAKCRESDLVLTEGVPEGEFRAYKCENGMWDIVTPLYVEGMHVANIFVGQFFYSDEVPDIAYFEEQAEEYGFERDAYLKAVLGVPRFSRETVDKLMRFYVRLAEQIAHSGYANLILSRTVDRLAAAERELSANREQLRATLDQAAVGIARMGFDGRYLDVNPALCEMLGYSADEMLAMTLRDVTHPDSEPSDLEGLATMARGERDSYVTEKQYVAKDGTLVWANMSSSLGRDAFGAPAYVVSVVSDISERKNSEEALMLSYGRLESLLKSITATMGKVVETRDPYTQGHQTGVARLSVLIGREMGLSERDVEMIEVAALVHDLGKLSVPTEILTKPGKLTDPEFELIKQHPTSGYNILKEVDWGWPIAELALWHHERMDGSGYPEGLAGDEIPMAARIIAVADVIEAMAAHRPYRAALGLDVAMAEITGHPEKFDATVVAACVRLHEQDRMGL